jgi:hypothetical protein
MHATLGLRRLALRLCFFAIWAGSGTLCCAQWTPLVAKVEKTIYRVAPDGPKPVKENVGIFMRNSHGSISTRDLTVSGRSAGSAEPAVLEDRPGGKVYRISYESRKAVVIKQRRAEDQAPVPQFVHRPSNPDLRVSKKVVGGVECELFRVPEAGETGRFAEFCFAPSLNDLIIESRFPMDGGMELVTTFEQIKAGEELDPALFRIPEGFQIIGYQGP